MQLVQTEVMLANYNNGAPDFFSQHAALHARGFALLDVVSLVRQTGGALALQFDALWARRGSSLWSEQCTGFPDR